MISEEDECEEMMGGNPGVRESDGVEGRGEKVQRAFHLRINLISMYSRVPQAVRRRGLHYCRVFSVLGLEVLSNLEGMTHTKNTFSGEETGAEELKGVQGARRAQTTSYRKSKELGRGLGGGGKELSIRTSQMNAAERPKTDSTEESKEEATQQGEQERSNQSSFDSSEEEGEQESGEESKEKSSKGSQSSGGDSDIDNNESEDKRGSGEKEGGEGDSGEQSDEKSGDKGEEEEIIEGKRVIAKGGSKAKPGTPKGEKPTDPPHRSLEGLKPDIAEEF
ncbi:hypothetical protein Scep_029083 [Stephania cephalantha]|uniref:Uncharacterized protein n=1 Tax=Stephania cephalantha TaxID=152367 RepID=A0AAP0E0J3_9MAGN